MKSLIGLMFLLFTVIPLGTIEGKTINIEYILDASGSMLELIQDARKIDIAKETLSDLIEQLPAGSSEINLNVGLRVYGHGTVPRENAEQRCRDTTLEVPIQGIDIDTIKQKIAGIIPRGWTPIAFSLEEAANDFPSGKDMENIIILISDGKETCQGDPCAMAGKLHQSGIKVKINVVGFDINPEERRQLECIAQAAGGNYFSAETADELSRALSTVQEQVLKKESQSVRIKIGGIGTLHFEPAGWVPGAPYRYRLESIKDGKVAAQGGGELEDLRLPPGTYRLVWDQTEHGHDDTILSDEVIIKSGETTTLKLNSGIHLAPAGWLTNPPRYWYLKNPASGEIVLRVRGNWDPALAPPGEFELWYRQTEHDNNDVRLAKNIMINEGRVTEFDLNTGITIVPSSPDDRPPYNWTLNPKDDSGSEVWVKEQWGPVPCPPGKYGFSLRQTQHGHSLTELIPEFTIKEGQLIELEL